VKKSIIIIGLLALLTGCSQQQKGNAGVSNEESREAKAMMQGVWLDAETEEVSFRVKGDSIYYADSTSMPAFFKIIADSLVLGSGTRYAIEKQTEHLFWFKNQNGDLVKLQKSDDDSDASAFIHDTPKIMTYTHQVKSDSVVLYNGNRYHWYIAINPTKYKVTISSYSDEGVEVESVYYDNIIHISVFKGARQLFSTDFKKQMYANLVPSEFLSQALLGNMQFDSVDQRGFHFNATLCIPDGATCYLVSTDISFDGRLSMKLMEY
jgi:hypothetical protein